MSDGLERELDDMGNIAADYLRRLNAAERELALERAARLVEATRVEELKAEAEEYHQLITRQGELLTGVANALRGDPPANVWWDHSDLPARAAAVREQLRGAHLRLGIRDDLTGD